MTAPAVSPPTTTTTATGPTLRDSTTVARALSRLVVIATIAAVAALVVVPIYFVMRSAVEDDARGVRSLQDSHAFGEALRTTVALGAGSVVVATVVGSTLAWFAHTLPRGRRWLGVLPLFPLVLPPLALVTGYGFLLSPDIGFLNRLIRALPLAPWETGPFDVYTVPWMILITGLPLASFVFLFVRASLGQMHQDLFDAAAASGAGPFRVYYRVVLPLTRPAIVYGVLTVALLSLGQFTVPLLLGRQVGVTVLSTEMYFELQGYPPDIAVASAYGLPIVAAGLIFICLQRILLRDGSRFVTSGARGARPLRPSGRIAQGCLALYGLFVMVLPLTALVIVSLQPSWSGDVDVSTFTLDAYREVLFDNDALMEAVFNSLRYALGTVVLTVPTAYLVARLIHRRRHPALVGILEAAALASLGIPAVIFGIGFLLAFTEGPFRLYSTDLGMVIVYSVLMLPFAVRVQLSARANIGDEMDAAAAANGAGLVRRTLRIDLPLMRSALASGAAVVILLTSHEFSASLLVRSVRTEVMGSVLYQLWFDGAFPTAAVMALLMCVVTAVAVGLALLAGGRGALEGSD